MSSFYSDKELEDIGFKSYGVNVKISRNASFYGVENIEIGDHCRIDDFCVFSAGKEGIRLGNYVHVAVFCSLMGKARITLEDFTGLSSRVSIYSSSDDYSGEFMTNPTVAEKFTNVFSKAVIIGRHSIVGSTSVILPGVTISEGVSIGAMSFVVKDCKEYSKYFGAPARRIGERKKDFLKLESEFLKLKAQNE